MNKKLEKINSPLNFATRIFRELMMPSVPPLQDRIAKFIGARLNLHPNTWTGYKPKRTGACRRPFASTPFAFDELRSTQRTIDDAIICHCTPLPLCSLLCHVQKHATRKKKKNLSHFFRKASPCNRQF